MSWKSLDPQIRALVEQTLTEKQLEVVRLKDAGFGTRRIARIVGVSPAAVRDRWEAAVRRLASEASLRDWLDGLDREEAA